MLLASRKRSIRFMVRKRVSGINCRPCTSLVNLAKAGDETTVREVEVVFGLDSLPADEALAYEAQASNMGAP